MKEREKAYSALTNLRETGGKNVEKDVQKVRWVSLISLICVNWFFVHVLMG